MSEVITSLADPAANIIFGAVVDDQYKGELQVTVIATGFATPSSINSGKGGGLGGPPSSDPSSWWWRWASMAEGKWCPPRLLLVNEVDS